MRDRRVDRYGPDAHEPEHGGKLHAFRKRASDECRGNDGEGQLEHRIERLRNRPCHVGNGDLAGLFHEHHSVHEETCEAAEIGAPWGKSQTISDQPP